MGNEKFITAKFIARARASVILEASSGMEEYDRARCICIYHEYKVLTALMPKPLSTIAFCTTLFARVITCIGRHVDNDPSGSGRPPFGLIMK